MSTLYGQVECFLVVAKLGSMSRAAEEMFLTQPSLTARIAALEKEVGAQLFVRTKQGMRLTEAGREFMPYAERCVGSIESGKQRLQEIQEGTKGHLKLGALPRVSTYTLPTLLEEFARTHPRVLVSIATGHSKDVLDMVITEEVQIGIARAMSHPDVENIPLYEEKLVLAVNPQHRFAERGAVTLSELRDEQLILFDRASGNYELTKSLFRNTGVPEPRIMELDNIEAAKRMVEHHLGIAFLPRQATQRAVAAGRLCLVAVAEVEDGLQLERSIVAMRRKDVPLSGAQSALLELAAATDGTLTEA